MNRLNLLSFIPFIYFLFAFANHSPQNYRTYTPRDSSYTISYPQTWEAHRGRRSFQLMLISPRTDSTDKFQENVIIFREDMEGKKLDGYVNYLIKEKLPKSVKGFSLISKKKEKINNLNSFVLEYKFEYRAPVKSLAYVFEKDGFSYVVLGTAPDSTYSDYKQIFTNVGHSFIFNKK